MARDEITKKAAAEMTNQERAAELRKIASRSSAFWKQELTKLADMVDPKGAKHD